MLKDILEDISTYDDLPLEALDVLHEYVNSGIFRFEGDLFWEGSQGDRLLILTRDIHTQKLILRFAQEGPVGKNVLHDPNIIKLEAGGLANYPTLVFEHRCAQNHPLVPHTLRQILFKATESPLKFSKGIQNKSIVLGDIDLGGALAYWLIKKIRQESSIQEYTEIINLVSQYDLQGRTSIYPIAEPPHSLFRIAWGIELYYKTKEEKMAAYLTLFDRIFSDKLDPYGEIPWHDKKLFQKVAQLIHDAGNFIDSAMVEKTHLQTLMVKDVPYTRAYWDEVCVQASRCDEKVIIVVSPTEVPERPVILCSSFSHFYLAPFGEQLQKEGLPAWYGAGYVGLDTRQLPSSVTFSPEEMQRRLDDYLGNRESLVEACEFEVVFDNRPHLEEIANAALGRLITGYIQSPSYYEITAAYLWNEYGQAAKTGETHTKINFDRLHVIRFLVPKSLKQTVYDYFYNALNKKWDTPLIKVKEWMVPEKFAEYMKENVKRGEIV